MLRAIYIIVIAFSSLTLVSCAGIFTGATISNVVSQKSSKYKFVRKVVDKEQTTRIFRIGGLGKNHLADIILERVKNGLSGDEELVNIAVTVSDKNYLNVYGTSIVELTADVVVPVKK